MPDLTATYQIVASTDDDIMNLQEGMALNDRVDTDSYKYYAFPVLENWDTDVTIVVSTFSGDPDLYVSTSIFKPNVPTLTGRRKI
jgi:hypothetical protein